MRCFVLLCFFIFYPPINLATALNNGVNAFDIKKANQEFDHLNLKLSVQNLNLHNLNSAVTTLAQLTDKAEQCVEDLQKKINSTEFLIKQDGTIDNKIKGADFIYLNTQQKILADEQAQCRLFTIRAKEAIEVYKTAITKLKQAETFTRGTPIWQLILQSLASGPEKQLKILLNQQLPAAFPPVVPSIIFILIALISSTFILFQILKSRFANHHLQFKKLHARYIVLLSTFFSAAALFGYELFLNDLSLSAPPNYLAAILFFYISSAICIVFSFKLIKIRSLFYWYSLDNRFLQNWSLTLLTFYCVALIGQLFSGSFSLQSPVWQLYQSTYILFTLAAGAFFIYSFCQKHPNFNFIKHHSQRIQYISTFIFSTCAMINILGYCTMAKHLTFSGYTTFAITFIATLMVQGIQNVYYLVCQQQTVKFKIMQYFGYRQDQTFIEFLILKTIAQLITVLISIYLIGESWGFATDFIENAFDELLNGVHLINITFYPTRIISGVVVFCLLYLVFRAFSTMISNHQQFEDEEETQVAVASILTYIGFSLALITGFLVAGFDFTGLAIIAGALSVGIGLGLQSIVNNFVSGLILLIEKPIRPGDRISVDGIEGFVKKIRVRSTQIITPSREDIIVPNSDLITRRVTNYMFSDKYYNISCEVGVAYGTDTHLVRDVLLEIANQHEEVVKNIRHKPVVLFRSFGDNGLIFQLGCLIKDVNKKSHVRSDLNYAIERAFRENDIHMASNQLEVHLNQIEAAPLKMKRREEILA